MTKDQQKPSVIESALAMASGTLISRVLGFVRDALVLTLFSRTVSDAFVVAFRLPNLARRLLGEGALGSAFIPVFIEEQHQSPNQARALTSAIFTLLASLMFTLSVAAIFLMEPLMQVWVGQQHGFSAVAGKLELTVALGRVMALYIFLVSTYAFFMSVANALGEFFIPSLAPAAFNLAVVVVAGFSPADWRASGYPLGVGVLLGGVLQTAMVTYCLYRRGFLPKWRWAPLDPRVLRVIRQTIPGIFAMGVYQVMTLANTYFAAGMAEGAQSYLYASDRILELPQSLIAISLGTAMLPNYAKLLASGEREKMLEASSEGLRMMLYLALPCALGLLVLAPEIVEALFHRGSFNARDVLSTARLVQIYSGVVLAAGLSRVTLSGFYAHQNTKLPAKIAAAVVAFHLLLAGLAVPRFGLEGLVGATALSAVLNMALLQIAFHRQIGSLKWLETAKAILRLAPALVALGLLAPIIFSTSRTFIGAALALGLAILASAICYFLISLATGAHEARQLRQLLYRRWRH